MTTYPFAAPFEYVHVHISEREEPHFWPDSQWDPAGWEDCLWTGATELHRYAGGDVPATLAEAEALRDAAGVTPSGPGSNHDGLRRGMLARFGRTFRRGFGEAELLALGPGHAAVISGSLAHFPDGHSLRRWDKDYDAGHAWVLYRVDEQARWWLCDGLAPSWFSGQWITDAQAKQFMYDGSLFSYARLDEFKEVPMIPFIDARSREVDLRAGAKLYDDAGKVVRTLEARANNVIAPVISSHQRSVVCARVAGVDGLALVDRDDIILPVRLPPEVRRLIADAKAAGLAEGKASVVIPPDTTPFTAADLTAKAGALLEQARTKSVEAVGKAIDDVAATLTEVVPHG